MDHDRQCGQVVVTADNYDELLASATDDATLPEGFPRQRSCSTHRHHGPAQGRAPRQPDPERISMVQGMLAEMWGWTARTTCTFCAVPRTTAVPAVTRSAFFRWRHRGRPGDWKRARVAPSRSRAPVTTTVMTPLTSSASSRCRRGARRLRPLALRLIIHGAAPCPLTSSAVHRSGAQRRCVRALRRSEGGAHPISPGVAGPSGLGGEAVAGVDVKVDDQGVIWIRPAWRRVRVPQRPCQTAGGLERRGTSRSAT